MPWEKIVDTEEDVFKERYVDQFGIEVGWVCRFYDDAPTYAWAHGRRLGAFESDDAAKAAVMARHSLSALT